MSANDWFPDGAFDLLRSIGAVALPTFAVCSTSAGAPVRHRADPRYTKGMRGSLDEPPIVVRTSRAKAVLRLGVLAVLILVMSPVARTHWLSNPLAWILIGLFGALALTSVWELVAPGRLVIGPNGMEQRHLWRRRRWSWRQARGFQPARNRFYRFVGFDRAPGAGHGDLNQDWELPPPALANLLNAARARWANGGS